MGLLLDLLKDIKNFQKHKLMTSPQNKVCYIRSNLRGQVYTSGTMSSLR